MVKWQQWPKKTSLLGLQISKTCLKCCYPVSGNSTRLAAAREQAGASAGPGHVCALTPEYVSTAPMSSSDKGLLFSRHRADDAAWPELGPYGLGAGAQKQPKGRIPAPPPPPQASWPAQKCLSSLELARNALAVAKRGWCRSCIRCC